jgi:hypothetical protein
MSFENETFLRGRTVTPQCSVEKAQIKDKMLGGHFEESIIFGDWKLGVI